MLPIAASKLDATFHDRQAHVQWHGDEYRPSYRIANTGYLLALIQ